MAAIRYPSNLISCSQPFRLALLTDASCSLGGGGSPSLPPIRRWATPARAVDRIRPVLSYESSEVNDVAVSLKMR